MSRSCINAGEVEYEAGHVLYSTFLYPDCIDEYTVIIF
jgi:hypothetical protein